MLLFYPFFKRCLWYFSKWYNWLLGEKFEKFISDLLFPFFPLPSIVLCHTLFSWLFSVHLWMHHTCHQLFCRSQCIGVCLLQVGPRQDTLRYLLLLWNCFIHWSFFQKFTDSCLSLSLSMHRSWFACSKIKKLKCLMFRNQTSSQNWQQSFTLPTPLLNIYQIGLLGN